MTKELDSTQDADLKKSLAPFLRLARTHENDTDMLPLLQDLLNFVKSENIKHADQVIGPDDPIQLASDAVGHIKYIQQVERNKLRSEQRKRKKA